MSTVKEFSSSPSLLPMYARAALNGPLRRGDSLPDTVYSLAAQAVDGQRLAAYQQVCGFRVGDELPPTYLHVLAFPLSVALMVQPSFPFPLVGLVHVANSITVLRSVRAGEQVSFTVQLADLRPHHAGRQLDVLADAFVQDELVWSGRSTYLRRGKSQATPERPKQAPADRSEPVGMISQLRVPENIGRRYAAVSGDRNPIHLHALTARAFGFPKAIAHGMWLKARTLAALEGRLPEAFSVDVAFKTPVLLPSGITIATAPEGAGWTLDVRNARSGKPHLIGAVRAL